MAVLTANQLQALRATAARNMPVHWTKAQINAAIQAIEDRIQLAGTKTALSNDIEAAAPGVFNASEKQILFGCWCDGATIRLGIS